MSGSRPNQLPRLLLFLGSVLVFACRVPSPELHDAGADTASDVAPDGQPDTAADSLVDSPEVDGADTGLPELALTGVQPIHGPFIGGTNVILRGRGFVGEFSVIFGERIVDPADIEHIDDNRIGVVTPAGNPGPVDVTIAIVGREEVTLNEGYTYDSWYVDPSSGSAGGGTLVRILGMGTDFDSGSASTVRFGTEEATDVTIIGATEITCRTPEASVGTVDVSIEGEFLGVEVLPDGYSYVDTSDPRNGGLGGGPIEGNVDVTVYDAMSGTPLPGTFVMLGLEATTPFQGYTNEQGRISFSDPSLSGQQMITAAHAPVDVFDDDGELVGQTFYESTSIVEFDARSVTILLVPIPPPSLDIGLPPIGRRGGFIDGELLFEHRGEFGPYEWGIVPAPAPGEVKVAFVYTSQSSTSSTRIEPGPGGIVFNTSEYMGLNGYIFSIDAYPPGTMAIYALAGLGRHSDPSDISSPIVDFIPYAMGVARGIVVGPDEVVSGIQVLMTHQMSRTISVELEDAPLADESGHPNIYIVDVFLDLGAEGYISQPETRLTSPNPLAPFDFPGWVDLTGYLTGASYTVIAGAWTLRPGVEEEQNPWSVVYRTGETEIDRPIVIDEFLAIPRPLSPPQGGVMENNTMSWEAEGGVTPEFSVATLSIPSGIAPVPFWMIVLRGGVTSYELPYLPLLVENMPEYPMSDLTWSVWSFSVQGFDFDNWSYRYFHSRYWSAYAVDSWYIRLQE